MAIDNQNIATTRPYLTFRLNDAEYGIPVEYVREIITGVSPCTVPGSPEYMLGVINLRGKILPMIDMRRRFNLPCSNDDSRDCFIVLTLDYDDQTYELGVRVDAVCEVQRIQEDSIDNISDLANYTENRIAFHGVAKTPAGIRLIVDCRQLIEQLRSDVQSQLHSRSHHTIEPACVASIA